MKTLCALLLLFSLSACRPAADAHAPLRLGWDSKGEAANDDYGYKCAWAGDVNGDGFDDFLVAAPGHDGNKGRLYLYYGSAKGLPESPSWTADGEYPLDGFSKSMGGAGDLNGDGFDDIYAASPDFGKPLRGQGKLYVFYGGPNGPATKPDWVKTGSAEDEIFGDCSSAIGDINGDGYDDMVVGAYGVEKGKGRVQVFLGGPQGLSREPVWSMLGEGIGDNLGYSHGSAGDVNGDGYGDLLVGAKYNGQAFRFGGKGWAFLGGPKGIQGKAVWIQHGESEDAMFTNRLYSAGDVNGDGYGDIVVGAPGAEKNAGKSYLYLGSAKGLGEKAAWTYSGPAASRSGHSVNSAGDVNDDGYDDVLVGMPGNPSSPGRAALFLGSAQGLATTPAWEQVGPGPNANYGIWSTAAGDINGDGAADVLIGSPGEDDNRGHVYLYLGQSGSAGLCRPHQWTTDQQRLIGPMGRSDASDAVVLTLDLGAQVSAGWVRGSLEAELKPLGQAFDGGGTQRSAYAPLATASPSLRIAIQGLKPGTAYRWRLRALGLKAMEGLQGEGELKSPWVRPNFGSLSGGAYFRTALVSKAKSK